MLMIEIAKSEHVESINKIRLSINNDKSSSHNLEDYNYAHIKKSDELVAFVATWSKEVIGYLKLEKYWIEGDAIFEVFVCSCFQGKGIGTKLINYAKDYIKKHMTFNQLRLGVSYNNINAIKLYEKLGFIEIKRDEKGKFMVCKI